MESVVVPGSLALRADAVPIAHGDSGLLIAHTLDWEWLAHRDCVIHVLSGWSQCRSWICFLGSVCLGDLFLMVCILLLSLLIHMSSMDLCNKLCSSFRPFVCLFENDSMMDSMSKVFNQFLLSFFVFFLINISHAWHKSTIDLHYFIQLSVALTLAESHRVTGRQNQLGSLSCTFLTWSGWNLIWCCNNANWTFSIHFNMRFIKGKQKVLFCLLC